MVQVDLITGFLGAGKTTFLRRYAAWWAGQGVKVCVLENDFGAVNVDAMLLQDLEAQGVELETISGGCDCDTHQRRMRTKLISMAMRGFDRVVIEPSGIFDVDEFFDVLRDEPLDRWYRLGNVIAIVDALLPEELSPQAEYILASESAWAGSVLLSRCQLASDAQKQGAEAHLARALEACKCSRKFGPEEIDCEGLGRFDRRRYGPHRKVRLSAGQLRKAPLRRARCFHLGLLPRAGPAPRSAGKEHPVPLHRSRLRKRPPGERLRGG